MESAATFCERMPRFSRLSESPLRETSREYLNDFTMEELYQFFEEDDLTGSAKPQDKLLMLAFCRDYMFAPRKDTSTGSRTDDSESGRLLSEDTSTSIQAHFANSIVKGSRSCKNLFNLADFSRCKARNIWSTLGSLSAVSFGFDTIK